MPYDYKAKSKNIKQLNNYMLAKTASMFEYQGLPESIPSRELEKLLQVHGYAFITKAPDGELYAFTGGLGGEPDVYGNPTTITISNPALKFNKTCNLKTDGVLIRNDDMKLGLLPYFEKQNTMLVENEINMIVWGYNSRAQKLISAPDDKTKASADNYLKKIVDGDLSVIADNGFFDGVKLQTSGNNSGVTVQQMTEFHQYIKASMYNEVGLSANFNMKRERLISSELDQSEDSLFPFVYNMMENRIIGITAINEMFGLQSDVDFGSVWALKNKELVDGKTGNNDLPDETRANNTDPENKGVIDPNGERDRTPTPGSVPDSDNDLNSDPESDPNADTENKPDPENDPNNAPENNVNSENEGNNDEQEQRQPDNQDNNQNSGNDSEQEKTVAELKAIINDPESSDEDKQAAQQLLDEMGNNNV